MSLYSSIEETKDLNNKKFNEVKEQVNHLYNPKQINK